MSVAITALVGFAFWTILLLLTLAAFRVGKALGGEKLALNQFSPAGDDFPGFGQQVVLKDIMGSVLLAS